MARLKAMWGVAIVLAAIAASLALLALYPPPTNSSLPSFIAKVKPFQVEESAGLSASMSMESILVSETRRLPMSFPEFLDEWDKELRLTPGSEAMFRENSFQIWQDIGGGTLTVEASRSGNEVFVTSHLRRKATWFDAVRYRINDLFGAKR